MTGSHTMTGGVALVTGGASGIGRATCQALADDGYRLSVVDLNGAGANEAAAAMPTESLACTADVADPDDLQAAVAGTTAAFGRIDLVVACAGITGGPEATVCHRTPVEELDRVLAVNVRGAFLTARAVLPTMLDQGQGHIVVVASVAGLVAFPGRSAYTVSKGAAVQLARSLAVDYGPVGIRANAVCPGFVDTPMTRWRLEDPELRAAVESRIPLGRVADATTIAGAISALASERLGYANGTALVVDGGWTAQ